jgi:hypothetical protein
MSYISVEYLQQMGVEVTNYPKLPTKEWSPYNNYALDSIFLSPARVRTNVTLDNGAIIPGGTVAVTYRDLEREDATPYLCFQENSAWIRAMISAPEPIFAKVLTGLPSWQHPPDEATRICKIIYQLPGGELSTARVRETFLELIQQGWNSPPPPAPQTPPPPAQPSGGGGQGGGAFQAPQPASPVPPARNEPPKNAPISFITMNDLHLRQAPDPTAPDVLGPPHDVLVRQGSEVTIIEPCKIWMGSGRGAQDADNIWCPVVFGQYRGWMNAAYLRSTADTRPVACVMYPNANGCSR